MTYQMRKSEVKLGGYYAVTVYHIFQDQFMEEESLGIDPSSYRKRLLNFLEKEIPQFSSQFKTLISSEPLLSPRIRYREIPYKSTLPARIFDDLLICKQRAYFSLSKAKAIVDQRMEFERKNDIQLESRQMEVFFKVGDSWYKILGVPDYLYDNFLVVELTITRGMIRHLLGRAVIYAYMCMRYGEPCGTLILPTTIGEDIGGEEIGYFVVPNGRVLDYLAEELEKVVENNFKAKKNKFCSACLYKRQCQYAL